MYAPCMQIPSLLSQGEMELPIIYCVDCKSVSAFVAVSLNLHCRTLAPLPSPHQPRPTSPHSSRLSPRALTLYLCKFSSLCASAKFKQSCNRVCSDTISLDRISHRNHIYRGDNVFLCFTRRCQMFDALYGCPGTD